MRGLRKRLPPRPTAFEARELLVRLALLPFGFAPRRLRWWAAGAVASLLMRRDGYRQYATNRIPPGLAEAAGLTRTEFAWECERRFRAECAVLWREILVPRWRRRVRIFGLAHVGRGLERGHGVILWVQPCVSTNVAVKQALHDAGYPLAHLSRPGHPFSSAPFGQRFVNPVLRRPEVRVLAERVVIDNEHNVTALRRLRALLRENRVVSISAAGEASRRREFAFFGATLRVPTGPVQLAAASGAALLPVFTSGPVEAPRVEIGAPLVPGKSEEEVERCQAAAVAWLEARAHADPSSWTGWRHGMVRVSRPAPATEPAPPAPRAGSESP